MITKLNNRALLKVSGPDAEVFLQSQFSNDIKQIAKKEIQINAYCQHQGKIIAIIWVFIKKSNYYLSFPLDLKEIVLTKLNMFKLMSHLDIKDCSSTINQYGVIGENRNNSYKINDNLSLLTTRECILDCSNNFEWELACIKNKIPEVYKSYSEIFIPQALTWILTYWVFLSQKVVTLDKKSWLECIIWESPKEDSSVLPLNLRYVLEIILM